MRRQQLIAAFLILMAVLAAVGCGKKATVAGDYGIVITEEFRKKATDAAMAFAKNDAKMKALVEKQLKDMDAEAEKVTVKFGEDGKCTFNMPNQPAETVDYTVAEKMVTIKAPKNSFGAGKDLVLTWDPDKGTLTAGQEGMGITFKKKSQ